MYLSWVDDDVVEGLVHTTRLARECTITLGIGTLLGRKHRVLHVAEVVSLDECGTAAGHTNSIFGVSVVVVVVTVVEGCADTWVARVAMVEPVMVVGHPAVGSLTLHTTERALAVVVEVVVAYCDMARLTLDVDGSVALSLVSVATSAAIEEVHVVNPYIVIVSIERNCIVFANHIGEVAQLNALGVTDEESETVSGGIEADTLDSDVHVGRTTLAFDLNTLGA